MAEKYKIKKVTDFPEASTLDGFYAFGTDGGNNSVKVPIGMLRGNSPHIGANGNWYVGDIDLGVHAQGEPGEVTLAQLDLKADEETESGETVMRSFQSNNDHTLDITGDDGAILGYWDKDKKFKAHTDYLEAQTSNNGHKLDFADEAGNIIFYIDAANKFRANFDFSIDVENSLGNNENKGISQDFFTKKYFELLDKIEPQSNTDVVHIIVLGQSLSMGYIASPVCSAVSTQQAFMFKHIRTQDFGYIYGITKTQYNNNTAQYDNDFYTSLIPLIESGGYGNASAKWENASPSEYETPCSGIAEGIYQAYREDGRPDIPFKILFTAPGIGGTEIPGAYTNGGRILERCLKDVQKVKALCDSSGLTYKTGYIVWVQGEQNYGTSIADYKTALSSLITLYNERIKTITGQADDIPFISYQTNVNKGSSYTAKTQYPALAQWELSLDNPLFYMGAPIYNLQLAADKVHLTNISTRMMGNSLGRINYRVLKNKYTPFKPVTVSKAGNVVTLVFDRKITLDSQTLSGNGLDLSEITSNAGFFPINAAGSILTAATVLNSDEKSVTITCSAEPEKLYYGFSALNSYTVGGYIREKEQPDAYAAYKLNLYMPNQIIQL